MDWALFRLLFLTLTFHNALCLTQSDGFNIGVVLGSIVAALLIVGIAGFLFYMFCIRRWLGIGEPPELGYKRQNDFNLQKQKGGPSSRYTLGVQGKAAPYEPSRPMGRYEVERAPQVALSGPPGPPGPHGPHGPPVEQTRQSPNVSYSSEEIRAGGRPAGYEVTSTRTYQQRTYTQSSGGGSPLSAAYLGTGV